MRALAYSRKPALLQQCRRPHHPRELLDSPGNSLRQYGIVEYEIVYPFLNNLIGVTSRVCSLWDDRGETRHDHGRYAPTSCSVFAWMDSNTVSRRKALAFRISTPIISFFSFSSTVIFGASSTLLDSGSSELTRCNMSSCSKYLMRVLFMNEPPGSHAKLNLLMRCSVHGHRYY